MSDIAEKSKAHSESLNGLLSQFCSSLIFLIRLSVAQPVFSKHSSKSLLTDLARGRLAE
jgi:hypothetical protein